MCVLFKCVASIVFLFLFRSQLLFYFVIEMSESHTAFDASTQHKISILFCDFISMPFNNLYIYIWIERHLKHIESNTMLILPSKADSVIEQRQKQQQHIAHEYIKMKLKFSQRKCETHICSHTFLHQWANGFKQ